MPSRAAADDEDYPPLRTELTTIYAGVPGRVVELNAGGLTATVDFFGTHRTVRLGLVDQQVAAGDYILDQDGYAIYRIPEREIAPTLEMYERLLDELARP